MTRPKFILAFSFVVLGTSGLMAQVMPITGAVSTSPATASENGPVVSSEGAAFVNFSMLSWRIGRLSPYVQPSLSGSTTTAPETVMPAPVAQSNNNPFVASTISMEGGLISSPSTAMVTGSSASAPLFRSVVPVSGSSSAMPVPAAVILSPRFSSFGMSNNQPVLGAGVNTIPTGTSGTPLFDTTPDFAGAPTPLFSAVPEPGTILLCGSVLAFASFGYWRRKTRATPAAVPEAEAILLGETNESMSS